MQLALAELAPGRRLVGLDLSPARLEHCADGLYESNGEFRARLASTRADAPDTLVGYFDARWVVQGGEPRIARMHLAAGGRARPIRNPELARCRTVAAVSFARRAWRVWVAPSVGGSAHSVVREVQPELAARGWADRPLRVDGFRGSNLRQKVHAIAGVRHVGAHRVALGVQSVVAPERALVQGYAVARESHLSIDIDRWRVATTAGYESTYWRVGAGPQLVRATVHAKHQGLRAGTETIGYTTYGHETSTQLGWLLEGAAVLPTTRRFGFELNAQLSSAPMVLPATERSSRMRLARPAPSVRVGLQTAW